MKRFLLILFSFALAVLLVTLIVNAAYIRLDNDPYGTDKFSSVPEHIRFCNFGSSHGNYGFCYDETVPEDGFNFALNSQSLSYDFRILSFYRESILPGATVYLTVSYHTLYGGEENMQGAFREKNQRYYTFLPRQYITDYSARDAFWVRFPSLTSYQHIVRVLSGRAVSFEDTWRVQTADDIDLVQDVSSVFSRQIGSDAQRHINPDDLSALYDMIALCRELEATPVLVTTPFLREYHEYIGAHAPSFLPFFRSTMADITSETGVTWLDLSELSPFTERHDYFMDAHHLNRTGALLFTEYLLELSY